MKRILFHFLFIFRTVCAILRSDLNYTMSERVARWKHSETCVMSFWIDLKGILSFRLRRLPADVCRLFCVSVHCSLEFPDEQMPLVVTQSYAKRMLTAPGQQLHGRFGWMLAGPQSPGQTQFRVMSKRASSATAKTNTCWPEIWDTIQIDREKGFVGLMQSDKRYGKNIFSAWKTWLCISRTRTFCLSCCFVWPRSIWRGGMFSGAQVNCFHMWLDVKETRRLLVMRTLFCPALVCILHRSVCWQDVGG